MRSASQAAVLKYIYDLESCAGCVLASNTSSLDIDEIASATGRPQDIDRFLRASQKGSVSDFGAVSIAVT